MPVKEMIEYGLAKKKKKKKKKDDSFSCHDVIAQYGWHVII